MSGEANPFNSIQKVCAVLRVLGRRSPLRLTEIAGEAAINKATAFRILSALIDEGFVRRAGGGKTYELGEEARALARSARSGIDLAELAQPSLLRLADRSGDTALLSVRTGLDALYVARAVGSYPLQPNYLQIGSRRPLGVGAGSLALLSWLPDAEIEAILDIVVPRLANWPRISARFLRERIATARRHGHTLLVDAAYGGMGGIGVPVRDETGAVVAALSIGAATDRVTGREAALAELLKKEAKAMLRAMAPRRLKQA